MVEGADREVASFAAMRKGMPGPLRTTHPVGDAAQAIVDGVLNRSRAVFAPKWLRFLSPARMILRTRLGERDARAMAPELDRLTAERVAAVRRVRRRAARRRPRHEAAAESAGHHLHAVGLARRVRSPAATRSLEAISARARSRSSPPPTLSAPRTWPCSRYQTPNFPSSSAPLTTSSSHVVRGPDVLQRGPVGEVAVEVRHLGVGLLRAEHRARDERALRARVLGVLDADAPPAVHDARVLADVARRPDARGARAQALVAADAAALAQLEAGRAREHHVGRDADAADDEVAPRARARPS